MTRQRLRGGTTNDEDMRIDVTVAAERQARSRGRAPVIPGPHARDASSAGKQVRKRPTARSGRTALPPHAKKKAHSAKSDSMHRAADDSRPRGSLFRIFRDPWRTQLERRLRFSQTTAADSGLGDREPAPEHVEFVRALNTKFKGLQDNLEVTFRAYCGGRAGYVVRRFALGCDADDVLSLHKPIGMGPVGLERYFQKHYGISWNAFLETPSRDLSVRLVRIVAGTGRSTTRSRTRSSKDSGTGRGAARRQAKVASGSRTKERAATAKTPPRRTAKEPEPVPLAKADVMPDMVPRRPRPAAGTRKRAPDAGPAPVIPPADDDKALDAAEVALKEIAALLRTKMA